ncbi:MAG TPA: hypothetical protein VKG44_07650 [Candidatus Baltobacteraceae bacterium]|nr:hypothetical protein [Candidatus Baltobacteraceae bacterium]
MMEALAMGVLAGVAAAIVRLDRTTSRLPGNNVWHDDYERRLIAGRRNWPPE